MYWYFAAAIVDDDVTPTMLALGACGLFSSLCLSFWFQATREISKIAMSIRIDTTFKCN